MKQVWIINHYAQIPDGAGGTRHFSIAKELKKYGWAATIFASSTELNTNRQRLAEDESFKIEQTEAGPFYWIRSPEYSGNGLGRIRNMLAFSWRLLFIPKTPHVPKPDIVVGSSVHPFAAFSAWLLSLRYNVPFVFEVRDLWPQTLIDLKKIKYYSPLAVALRGLERILYKRASAIVTLLPTAWEYISRYNIDREKIKCVPNGADLDIIKYVPPRPHSEKTRLMYLGSFGNANGIDQLLDGMREIKNTVGDQTISLELVGDGPLKGFYQEEVVSKGLVNCVSFLPSVPKFQIPTVASKADAFVVCLPNIPLYKYGISLNKIFDYMALGRPTIFAGISSNNPISESASGFSIPPNNPQALRDAILELHRLSHADREVLGVRAHDYAKEHYSYTKIAQKFADVLNTVLNR